MNFTLLLLESCSHEPRDEGIHNLYQKFCLSAECCLSACNAIDSESLARVPGLAEPVRVGHDMVNSDLLGLYKTEEYAML